MSDWVWFEGVGWRHRPWWKRAINTPLRALQRLFTSRPWLVCTISDGGPDDPNNEPECYGYAFARVEVTYGD